MKEVAAKSERERERRELVLKIVSFFKRNTKNCNKVVGFQFINWVWAF